MRKREQQSWESTVECGGFPSMASGISGEENQYACSSWVFVFDAWHQAMRDVQAAWSVDEAKNRIVEARFNVAHVLCQGLCCLCVPQTQRDT